MSIAGMQVNFGVDVVLGHPKGFGNFEADGVRKSSCIISMLCPEYQDSPHKRAELIAAQVCACLSLSGCFLLRGSVRVRFGEGRAMSKH